MGRANVAVKSLQAIRQAPRIVNDIVPASAFIAA
jgi:hypothetical protein